jgi:hypothetical protein
MSSPKQRSKFSNRIDHALIRDLDSRFLYYQDALPDDKAKRIRRLLGRAGQLQAQCHVMSSDGTIDGQDMSLGQAEAEWDWQAGILISVVPGKLVYYRPERPSKNYVLLKD